MLSFVEYVQLASLRARLEWIVGVSYSQAQQVNGTNKNRDRSGFGLAVTNVRMLWRLLMLLVRRRKCTITW